MRASAVLHCNLNVRSLAAAQGVYEGLGMRVRMRSRGSGNDATPLGLPGSTDSEAWFLYDHRGGRVAPAVELVEWTDPKTAGETYDSPSDVGMQALGFAVPSIAAAVEALQRAGAGTAAGRRPASVTEVVADADGVTLELVHDADPAATGATLRYARLVCADLEVTTDWYATIGFAPLADVHAVTWSTDAAEVEVREVVLTLGDRSGFELRLTEWSDTPSRGPAHQDANHRGLFRMALAVADVRAAVDAARSAGIDASDATYMRLPDTPLGGLWVSFFRDPDGVMVEFVERPSPDQR